ncbi:hypothetical protein V2J09_015643 [Rumex salicifolius]
MESFGSTPSISFRSKKPALRPRLKKPANPPEESSRPARVRNQNKALSIGDVKRTAQKLRMRDPNRPDPDSDKLRSLRSDLSSRLPAVSQRGSVKAVGKSVNLPEKYLMLCEFFNVFTSVIPLLRMRGKSSTLANICPKIQSLTDRRFTIYQLAQLKYIMPEVILVKRIHVRDERTDCMKEELFITLDMEAVKARENLKDIREIFRARIEAYYETHSEENDIPEGELPALFYQPNQNEAPIIDKSSCISPFSRHVSSEKLVNQATQESSPSKVFETPIKTSSLVMKDASEKIVDIHGTPAKEALTPIRLMATTPAIKPSKRCYMSPDDDDTCDMPSKLVRRSSRTRPLIKSLKFDVSEDSSASEVQADSSLGFNIDSDIIDFVPEKLMLSVRENERKLQEEKDPAISQAKRRHQLMAGVPKLLDMINLLFHSINRSVMTKEELLYKIISSHCDIVDRGEIEEQFKLLLELAPEYMSEHLCSSGDTLIRLNKSVSAESVRAKLVES